MGQGLPTREPRRVHRSTSREGTMDAAQAPSGNASTRGALIFIYQRQRDMKKFKKKAEAKIKKGTKPWEHMGDTSLMSPLEGQRTGKFTGEALWVEDCQATG